MIQFRNEKRKDKQVGFLTNNFIADGFYWFIELLYGVIPNYIVVILLSSLIVHVILSPLDMKQKQSALRMQKLQPKMAEIKKRYPDPQKQNAKIQELYRKENVSMTAGCLPMVFKMIFMLAFFGALHKVANMEIAKIVQQAVNANGQAIELPGLLWVRNIYMPDSGLARVMPEFADWQRIIGSISGDLQASLSGLSEEAYNAAIGPTISMYSDVGNGWFILPVIQGVLMYISMTVSAPKESAEANPMTGTTGKLVMSAVMAFVCITTNTLFTIYFIFSNILSTVISLLFNWYYKRKDTSSKQEQIVGE